MTFFSMVEFVLNLLLSPDYRSLSLGENKKLEHIIMVASNITDIKLQDHLRLKTSLNVPRIICVLNMSSYHPTGD